MKRYVISLTAGLALLLAGCAGEGDQVVQQPPPPQQTVAGTWQGVVGNPPAGANAIGDRFDVQFNLTGTVVQGVVRVIELNGTVHTGNIVTGSIVGQTINAQANMGAFGTITYQGTWNGANTINGTYTRTQNNVVVEDAVPLNLTRGQGTVTVNGNWSGTYTNTQGGGQGGIWSATFTQNGNRLTASNATINGQPATVMDATIIGDRITFGSGNQLGIQFSWNGTVNQAATAINGTFSANTGISGTFQGTRQQ
jgi:hypothetical protein